MKLPSAIIFTKELPFRRIPSGTPRMGRKTTRAIWQLFADKQPIGTMRGKQSSAAEALAPSSALPRVAQNK